MKGRTLRMLARGLALLCAGAVVGYLLLVAVYAIPHSCLNDKIGDAVRVMERESAYRWHRRVDVLNRASALDSYADTVILNEAFTESEGSPARRTVSAIYRRIRGVSIPQSFLEVYGNHRDDYYDFAYVRYWHGYLAVLKPLLTLFTYSQIQWINAAALTLLLCAVVLLMRRRGLGRSVLPFLATVLCVAPLAVCQSLQYSNIAYPTLLGMVGLLAGRRRDRMPFAFLLTGMLTSYLDLLSFPVMCMTMMLMTGYLILRRDGETPTLRTMAGLFLAWGIGYAGMWMIRFAISTAVFGRPAWNYIWSGIRERSGNLVEGAQISRLRSLAKCFGQLLSNYLGMLSALCCLVFFLRRGGRRDWKAELRSKEALPLYCLAAIPVVWLLVMGNHTATHTWSVYRNLAVLVWIALTLAQGDADAARS